MNKIEERLRDLRHEVYNAEDLIDGCYDSKNEDFKKYKEINLKYESLLKSMNELVGMLNNTLNQNKEDE